MMYLIWLHNKYWYNSCVIGFIVCVNIYEIKQKIYAEIISTKLDT